MRINKDIKKFFIKCMIMVVPWTLFVLLCIYTDVFNVFHPKTVRKTRAAVEERFLKVKYLLENPEKFNAFIFGSSHVGHIPVSYLNDNSDLHWYNMTYSMGCPKEHLNDLCILVESGVQIRKIIVGIDGFAMCIRAEYHLSQLQRKPYSEYVRLGWKFYIPYLTSFRFGVFKDVLRGEYKTEHFYGYGSLISETETFLPGEEDIDHKSTAYPVGIPYDTTISDIRAIRDFCLEHDIEVIFVTNPMWKKTYIDDCANNYLDFLYEVAKITPFINFSCLNEITCDGRNYYEGSHFRPNIGLLMLRILLNEDFEEHERLDSSQFGILVTQDNADSVISLLRAQLDSL